MIFVTVGHTKYPFQRLVDATSALPQTDLLVQYGPARRPNGKDARPFMGFQEVMDAMLVADIVICHAGVGSILCARRAGHTPIVVPRLHRFGEAVDDHQLELAGSLARNGDVVLCGGDEVEFTDIRSSTRTFDRTRLQEPSALVRAVRRDLLLDELPPLR